jgi:hypothetical protein
MKEPILYPRFVRKRLVEALADTPVVLLHGPRRIQNGKNLVAVNHHATSRFWACYEQLPGAVRDLADTSFDLLKENPRHPCHCTSKK